MMLRVQLCMLTFLLTLGCSDSSSEKHHSGFSIQQANTLKDEDNSVFNQEVQTMLIDKINAEIDEFEDLKTQIAVLDRHVRKHSSSDSFAAGFSQLDEIDRANIDLLERNLKVMRKEIIASKNAISSEYVLKVNRMVEKADEFLEINFEKVYGALDTHLESEDHRKEHDHEEEPGHAHAHDSYADYADLINREYKYEDDAKEVLFNYIDKEINEFENDVQIVLEDVEGSPRYKDAPKKSESKTTPNPVSQYSDETRESLRKAAEDSDKFLHQKNLAGHHTHVTKEILPEEIPQSIVFIVPVVFFVMVFIIIAVFIFGSKKKPPKTECGGEAVCDDGATARDSVEIKQWFGPKEKSPELLLEKELPTRDQILCM